MYSSFGGYDFCTSLIPNEWWISTSFHWRRRMLRLAYYLAINNEACSLCVNIFADNEDTQTVMLFTRFLNKKMFPCKSPQFWRKQFVFSVYMNSRDVYFKINAYGFCRLLIEYIWYNRLWLFCKSQYLAWSCNHR